MTPSHRIRATAPIRICDNGGWTDTWVARRGKVFNLAVRPLVSVRIDVFPRNTREAPVILDARNYSIRYAPELGSSTWGPHPLLEASFREIRPPEAADIEVTIRSDAPAGASTGTSAAVLVALLGGARSAGGRPAGPAGDCQRRPCRRDRPPRAAVRHSGSTVLGVRRRELHRDDRVPPRGGVAAALPRSTSARTAAAAGARLPWPAAQFLADSRAGRARAGAARTRLRPSRSPARSRRTCP